MMNLFNRNRKEREAKEEMERNLYHFHNACFYRAIDRKELVVTNESNGSVNYSYPLYEDLKAEFGLA